MFPTVSRGDAYLFYVVSVSLDMEFSLRGEEVVESVIADLLNAWFILRSCPISPIGATISTTFAYGDSTEFATVGPRILRLNGVSVHRARVTHARVRGRWLAFTPPMEKLLLVPSSRKVTLPELVADDLNFLETFARTHLSGFVAAQCVHAGFDTTIRTDVAGAVFVASRAQALLSYFNATTTSFTSLVTTSDKEESACEVGDDDGGWAFDVPDILEIVPSRVLVADPIDIATSYIEQTFHPLDFVIFAPRTADSATIFRSVQRSAAPQPITAAFKLSRVVKTKSQAATQREQCLNVDDFVLV